MSKMWIWFFAPVFLFAGGVQAHPVSFAGAFSLMSYNKDDENELFLGYSMTSRTALAVSYVKTAEAEYTLPRMNFLAKRWNNEDSQGNVYLSAGYGTDRSFDEVKGVAMASADLDWESRKYYTAFQYTKFFRQDSDAIDRTDFEQTKLRAGVAPYLAEFNELNTWLIVQFEKKNDSAIETTQFVRLFYRNILIEVGARIGGGAAFNFMTHF
ncbi:MAG: hypothetical protein OM95_00405 [Bdellovibrio sp. ArHS]|uniref:hypothetical protein n=1 Tax=Bdellovibrio sp. ArHS TaxID=1569284 RepID=UPI00058261D5|nr:hypothetical protein [Bdellovibrio sp. ArHS]KHD90023.1 MAG: hypothetical protein OM95_00405 [Bdellovibrio sp. ArHS]